MMPKRPSRRAKDGRSAALAERRRLARYEAVGVLAGGVAHDVNNLLLGAAGAVEAALREVSGGAPAALPLHRALAAIEQSGQLLAQVLALLGDGKPRRDRVRLDAALGPILDLLAAGLPERIALRCRLADAPEVIGDPVRLGQVALNLVANAAAALGERGGTVEVTLDVAPPRALPPALGLRRRRHARLVVRDDGPGMTRAVLARIFELSFTTRPGGRGIGLPVVRDVVAEHGGAVAVESKPGAGSAFAVYLPLAPPPRRRAS